MLLGIKITTALVVLHQQLAQAHGNHGRHHHHHDDEPEQHDHHSSLRIEHIFSNSKPKSLSLPPGQCKDGDPTFTLGGKTYQCEDDFRSSGGACRTLERSPEEEVIDSAKFQWWKDQKEKQKGNNGNGSGNGKNKATNRRLGGCADTADCVDWDAEIITVPTYFHIIHYDNLGRKYTCDFDPDSATYSEPFSDSSCGYIQDQMKVLNDGFRARESAFEENEEGRSYPRYSATESDTRIQFCLSGTTVTNNQRYYENNQSDSELDMKKELDIGGMETLNVYVNTAGGNLGYAYYPQSNDSDYDGVVLLNDSMPGGSANFYDEGDTLTHEVGHWLNLEHTHFNQCDGPGDYMDLAGQDEPNRENGATFDCPVDRDNCSEDGGVNPIHNFMAYTHDNCMDEFTPGQKMRMQSAWDIYRHKDAVSGSVGLADDGITCCTLGDNCGTDTDAPTLPPTNSPIDHPSKVPTEGPTTKPTPNPTGKPSYAGKPSKAPIGTFTADPTESLTGVPTQIPTKYPTPPPTSKPTKKRTKKRNRRLQKSLFDQFKGSIDKAHEDSAGEVQD